MIKANYKDRNHIIEILCDSFDQNGSVNYVIKQDSRRKKRIRRLMEYSFDMCYLYGQTYLSDNREGCALILLPEKKKTSIKTVILDAKLVFGCIGISRILKILRRDSKIKSNYLTKEMYYLWFIGVKPDKQKKGTGSQLLSELIEESERLKRPVYLETSMPGNLRLYEKHNFKIYHKLDFGHTLFLLKKDF